MRPNKVRTAAKERFSYPLRPELASAGTQDLAVDPALAGPLKTPAKRDENG